MTIEELILFVVWFSVLVVIQGMILIFLIWLLRKKQTWALMMFALRGGSLVLKGNVDNTVEILHSKKPVEKVKWQSKDPLTGKKRDVFQKISKVFHTLKGTSYPIHVCPATYPTNINIMTKEKAELNVEEINALMGMEYTQGVSDATQFNKVGGFPIDKATLVMLFVVGIMVIVLIMVNLQILDYVGPR